MLRIEQGGLQHIWENCDVFGTKRLFKESDTSYERKYFSLSNDVKYFMFISGFDKT